MAFPTGSIANNTVYKIGNRAWVYNLALGVWDQVADNDTDASNLSGTLGAGVNMSGVTFPAGHIIKITSHSSAASIDMSSNTEALESDANDITVSCTIGNILHITIAGGYVYSSGSGFHFGPGMQIKEAGQSNVTVHGGGCYARSDGGSYDNEVLPSIIYPHTAVTTSVTIKAAMRANTNCTAYWNAADAVGRGKRRYLIMEAQA